MKSNIARKIRTGIVLGALALGIAGCGNSAPGYVNGYHVTKNEKSIQDSRKELEGIVTDVQPQSLSMVWMHGGANHPITFVLIKGNDGKNYSFIYPYAIGVQKARVKIEYMPVNGSISQKDFFDKFVGAYAPSEDKNFKLETQGIILGGGITYLE